LETRRGTAVTDLTGTQISSLLETLPGIAQVLRSPVADAFVGLIRASSGQGPFNPTDAEEVMRYAVRRNLISSEESEKVLLEAREAMSRKPAPPPPPPKPVVAVATKPPAQVARHARTPTQKKPAAKVRPSKPAPRPARKVKAARVHRKK
jgi:hypothetical protein